VLLDGSGLAMSANYAHHEIMGDDVLLDGSGLATTPRIEILQVCAFSNIWLMSRSTASRSLHIAHGCLKAGRGMPCVSTARAERETQAA